MGLRLYTTRYSPFGRKIQVLIRELGVKDLVEEVLGPVRRPDSPVLAVNPLGKVPTLVAEDGTVLTESLLITDYLEGLPGVTPLTPAEPRERLEARAFDGFATQLLDSVAWRFRELYRAEDEPRSPAFIAYEESRANRGFDALEAEWAGKREGHILPGHITVAMACAFSDLFLKGDWRVGRPRLVAWYGAFRERSAMVETAPPPR